MPETIANGVRLNTTGGCDSAPSIAGSNALTRVSVAVAVGGVLVASFAFWIDPWLSLIPVSFVFGWTQVATPCGVAIIGAFTAQAKPRGDWRRWRIGLLAYTVSGLVSSMLVGAAIGCLGLLLHNTVPARLLVLGLTVVALLLVLREAEWLSFPLPQKRRPSIREFGRFGYVDSAVMWGFHIGLGFDTFANYGGPYVLALGIVASGANPVLMGIATMGIYWLGRALSAWLAPGLGGNDRVTMALLYYARASRPVQQRIQVIGMSWYAAVGAYVLLA